jgi:ABC-2 type transport system permease protein
MSKIIPVSPQKQVVAKFIHSYLVALLGIAFASAMMVGGSILRVVFLSFRLNATTWAAALTLSLVASFALTAIGMCIDLARPLLDWTNPQKAIKQNLNVLFATLVDVGTIALLGWLSSALVRRGLGTIAIVVILLTVLMLLSLAVFWLLLRFALNRYVEIEV